MPGWAIKLSKEAEKDLARLGGAVRKRVIDKLEWLATNFDSLLPFPLTGEFSDFYKLRVGDWRIFYLVNWATHIINIEYIGHRNKSYKKGQ